MVTYFYYNVKFFITSGINWQKQKTSKRKSGGIFIFDLAVFEQSIIRKIFLDSGSRFARPE